ncbi:MAG: hypothetical protein ABIZ49_01075 [Opitutaceae bacterium]
MRRGTLDGARQAPLPATSTIPPTGRPLISSRRKFRVAAGGAVLLAAGLGFLLAACTGPAASNASKSATSALAPSALKPAPAPALALDWPAFQKKVLPFFAENCADCPAAPA